MVHPGMGRRFSSTLDFIKGFFFIFQFPKVSALLEEISEVDEKELASSLSASFLTIYSYLSLNEPDEVNDKCIDFVVENTTRNLYHLLQSDITVRTKI
jgi:hypothetical protein